MSPDKIQFDSVRDNCSNCFTAFCDPQNDKFTKIKVRNEEELDKEANILEVLTRIFEISWNEFAVRYFIEETDTQLCNTEPYLKNIGLCKQCETILSQMYDAYLKFEILSHTDSLIRTAKLFTCNIPNKSAFDGSLDDHEISTNKYTHHDQENSNVHKCDSDPYPYHQIDAPQFTSDELEEEDLKYVPDCDNSTTQQLVVKLEKVSVEILNKLSTAKRKDTRWKIPYTTRSGRTSRGRLGSMRRKVKSGVVDYGCGDANPSKINFKKGKKRKEAKPVKKYDCQQCDKVFNVKKLLLLHKKVHRKKAAKKDPGPGPHQCNVCGKFYRSYKHLKSSHMQMHEGKIESVTCHICGKVLKSKYCLNVHVARKHPSDEEKAKSKTACKICGKIISIHNKTHITLHSVGEGRKFKCDTCGRLFRYKCLLNEHMQRHDDSSAPKNICELCGRSFPLERELKAHIKRHSVQRNFECDQCGNKFKRIHELNRHKITHTNDRPFVCDECGKTFKLATHLTIHLKCHRDEELGKEKFKCTECDKYFKHSLGLYKHQVKYHRPDLKKKIYECPYCSKRFAGATGLKLHVNSHEKQLLMNDVITLE